MTSVDVGVRVRKTLELALGGPIADDDVSRETDSRWDSIKNVEFVFLLEDEFGIQLSEEDVAQFASVSSVVRIVEAHLAA